MYRHLQLVISTTTLLVGSLRQSPSARRRFDKQNTIGPITIAVGVQMSKPFSALDRPSESLLLGQFHSCATSHERHAKNVRAVCVK